MDRAKLRPHARSRYHSRLKGQPTLWGYIGEDERVIFLWERSRHDRPKVGESDRGRGCELDAPMATTLGALLGEKVTGRNFAPRNSRTWMGKTGAQRRVL